MTLTHVDLFAGIGGFGLSLERARAKTVASVEIDKYCRNILKRHFPDVKQFDDIKNVSGDDLRAAGFIPERGIITGGFPCQDISIAGRGAGLAGDRSGLFWEIVRLLEELHPKWFILENVPRLLSINGGRDMATVIQALVDCGYGVAWRVLDARYFGVPQRRRRVFIVGHLGGTGRTSAEVLFERQSLPGNSAQGGEAQPQAAGRVGASAHFGGDAITHTHLDAPGWREARPSDRCRSGSRRPSDRVNALTVSGLVYGADENAAQAGHLIVDIPSGSAGP